MITGEDGLPLKDIDGNLVPAPSWTTPDGGITWTGKVPPNVDGEVTVKVPAKDANDNPTYTDKTGNPGTGNDATVAVDTTPPGVKVEITPNGDIKVTFDPDVDPSTIDPNTDFVITGEDGLPLKDIDGNPVDAPQFETTDGGITWTGKVPPNVESEIKVEVPAGTYTDKVGNPGKLGNSNIGSDGQPDPEGEPVFVDTAPPGVKVEITPDGKITVTFDPDVDTNTISLDDIQVTLTDEKGEPILDDDGRPVTIPLISTDGGIIWTGEVPPNLDGIVKVEVPENSYKDKTGNLGTGDDATVAVDTTPPGVKIEITTDGDIKVTFDPDVDPSTIDPNTDFVITGEDGLPLKDIDGNLVPAPSWTTPDGGITWTGKVPPNVDGEVTVKVPAKDANDNPIYTDKTGNPGTGNDATVAVDTTPPGVKVEITPDGKITVTFDPDVDPSTIDPNTDFVITDGNAEPLKDKNGDLVPALSWTTPDGGITWTGKIPPNVESEVKVEVPADSYTDKVGNPGKLGNSNIDSEGQPDPEGEPVFVDTAPPSVKVEIGTDGKITVTFDPDVDPSTIDPNTDFVITGEDGLPLKDKNGNPFTLEKTDDPLIWTGKVPPNVDGEVTVKVPENSYKDKTGNLGTGDDATVPVDTTPPGVKVEITPDGKITVTFDPDVDTDTISLDDIQVTLTDKEGKPILDKEGKPVTVPPLTSADGGITWTGKVPPNIDGKVNVEVPAKDADGNPTYTDKTGNPGTGNDATVAVDTTPPTVTVEIEPETIKTVIISGVTSLELGDIVTNGQIVEDSLIDNGDGTWTVKVKVNGDLEIKEIIGQPEATTEIKDSVIVSNNNGTNNSTVTFKFSETLKDGSFTEADIKVTGGTLVPNSLNYDPVTDTWTAEIKVTLGQEVTVEVRDQSYEDLAGNKGSDGHDVLETIKITSVKPTEDGQSTEITVKSSQKPEDIILIVDGKPISIVEWIDNGDGTYTFRTEGDVKGDKITATTTTTPTDDHPDGEQISDTVSLPFVSIDTIAFDDVINKAEWEDLTQGGDTITITGKISNSDPDTLTVTVNGETYTYDKNLTNNTVAINGDGTWSIQVPKDSIKDTNHITAVATAEGGRSISNTAESDPIRDIKPPTVKVVVDEDGNITVTFDSDVDRDSIKPETDIVITDKNSNPLKDKDGKLVTIKLEASEDGLTWTGKVPSNVEGGVKVEVPALGEDGKPTYTDKAGNPGEPNRGENDINMVPPTVTVIVDKDGNITVTFDPDVDPSTIDPETDIVITDKEGNPLKDQDGKPVEITLTPSEDHLTWTGKVPSNVEGGVKVEVPATDAEGNPTYTDKAGNPGEPNSGGNDINMVPPGVTVVVDKNGNITVTFDPDVDPDTIDPDTGFVITDRDGNPIEITLKPSEDGLTWTGKVPEDVEGKVTVEVPEGSYTDKAGNPGEPNSGGNDINMVPPTVTVIVDKEGNITVTFDPDVDPDTIDPETDFVITDRDGNPIEITLKPSEDGLTWTGKVPEDVEGKVTVEVPEGSYTDKAGNPGESNSDENDINMVPPTVIITLEESNLADPHIIIEFSEVPCGANGVPLTAEQVKDLLTTQGFNFDSGLVSKDGGLTWAAPITYTSGDAKADIANDTYFDAAKNAGSGNGDILKAPEVISKEPTQTVKVTGGDDGNGSFSSSNSDKSSSSPSDSKAKKHNTYVELSADDLDTARIIINLTLVDNSFALLVNGQSIIDKGTNTNTPVFQLQAGDKVHGTNQIILQTADGKPFGDSNGTTPWNENANGLPRIQVVIDKDGIRFFASSSTSSSELIELFISDADKSRINLPELIAGKNEISVWNHDGTGVDAIAGNVKVLTGEGFVISDEDGAEVSKAVIKVSGELQGALIIPVLPKGIKASWSKDGSELTLTATNGALSHKDFSDAINLLMFGVKKDQTVTDGERTIEVTIYDEDGLKSSTATGTFDYKAGLGNIYVNQFDFTDPTVTTVSPAQADEGEDLVHTITLSKATTHDTEFSFKLGGGINDSATADDYGTPRFSNGVTYDATTGKITVPKGVDSFTVTYTATTDNEVEGTETVTLEVGGVTGQGEITDALIVPENGVTATLVDLIELSGVYDDSLPGLSEVYKDQNGNYDVYDTFSVNLGLSPEQKEQLAAGNIKVTVTGPNGEQIQVTVDKDGVITGKISDIGNLSGDDLKVSVSVETVGSSTPVVTEHPITVTPVENIKVIDYAQNIQTQIDDILAKIKVDYIANGNPQPTYDGVFHKLYKAEVDKYLKEHGLNSEWDITDPSVKQSIREQVWNDNPDLLFTAFQSEIENKVQGDMNGHSSKDDKISDIHVIDIDAYLALKALAPGFSNKLTLNIDGPRDQASDWIIFDKPFDSSMFIIESKMTNNGKTNFFDNYGVIYKNPITGEPLSFMFNNIQGVAFGDGTVITANADGVITSFKNFSMTLSSAMVGDDVDGKLLGGLKFSSSFIDSATETILVSDQEKTIKPEIYLNGKLLVAEKGWYVLTDSQAAAFKTANFELTIKVPTQLYDDENDPFGSAEDFKAQFEAFLNKEANLEALLVEPTAQASMMRMSMDYEDTSDIIFDLLNDDNTGGNTLTTVEHFTSTDHINVSDLLDTNASLENINEYLTVSYDADADQAVISIDRDGTAGSYQSTELLVLNNQTTDVTLKELLENNQIIIF
ncbi:type I secretion C-terminal target domain-containing protein [Acinetobacter wuhouensis]|nr:type I secretion C-terminal target domain-containing protein [Acinetobacter wuhouensis]